MKGGELKGLEGRLIRVEQAKTAMVKRKAEEYLNAGVGIEGAGCEATPKECPVDCDAKATEVVPTVAVGSRPIRVSRGRTTRTVGRPVQATCSGRSLNVPDIKCGSQPGRVVAVVSDRVYQDRLTR